MDDTIVNVNPVRRYQQGDTVEPRVPTYMKRLICFREFAIATMTLLAWLLCLCVLGAIIWIVLKRA
jgi:hypothetical protein